MKIAPAKSPRNKHSQSAIHRVANGGCRRAIQNATTTIGRATPWTIKTQTTSLAMTRRQNAALTRYNTTAASGIPDVKERGR